MYIILPVDFIVLEDFEVERSKQRDACSVKLPVSLPDIVLSFSHV